MFPEDKRPPLGPPDPNLLCNGHLPLSLSKYNFLSQSADVDFYMFFIARPVSRKEIRARPQATNTFKVHLSMNAFAVFERSLLLKECNSQEFIDPKN